MNMYNPHELYHHGILGQKWGIRRFQNKDGTLTPAGRKRKAKLEAQYEKVTGHKVATEQPKPKTAEEIREETARRDAVNEARLQDVRSETARLKAENDLMKEQINFRAQYAQLHPPEVKKSKEFVKKKGGELIDKVSSKALDLGVSYLEKYAKDQLGLSDKKSDKDKLKETYEILDYKKKILTTSNDIERIKEKMKKS